MAQDIAVLNDAFAQLLNCDIDPDRGWNGDEKWIGDAADWQETRTLLVDAPDAAEREDLIARLLDALGELDAFARRTPRAWSRRCAARA